jgi:hypothetical protein
MAATNKYLARSNKSCMRRETTKKWAAARELLNAKQDEGKMREIVQLGGRRRQVKFTPERIEQIKNLVERGKRREEIAELIGVTVGSLQVTCSRLGISLRRPSINNGIQPQLKPVPTPSSKPAKAADVARFAISMRYRGEERTTELPLTQDMIRQLAVEAAFRGVPICDLIGSLIMGTLQAHSRKEAAPVPSWVAEAEAAEAG